MGLSYSSAKSTGKPATLLPIVGNGRYEVGCVDVMIRGEHDGDCGFFARLFYPSTLKSETHVYPVWRPRNEYVLGLAEYRQVSPMKINLFLDWIVGEKRVPAAWHAPLFHQAAGATTVIPDAKQTNSASTANDEEQPQVDQSAAPAGIDPSFPVIVFSHGISGNRLCYSTICASLASHGFVIAAVEHRDRSSSWTYYLERDASSGELKEKPVQMATFPDGETEFQERNEQVVHRVVESIRCLRFLGELNNGQHTNAELNADNRILHGHEFDWSQFKDRLDVANAAIVGHSFGGATALLAACDPAPGFKACVVLDGWLYPLPDEAYEGCSLPTLLLNVSRWQWQENVRRMMRLNAKHSEKIVVTLKDIVHQSFSDFGFLAPGYLGRYFGLQGELDPTYTGKVILELLVGFLNHHFAEGASCDSLNKKLRPLLKLYEHFVLEGTDLDLSQPLPKGDDGMPTIIDGGEPLADEKPDGSDRKGSFGFEKRSSGMSCATLI